MKTIPRVVVTGVKNNKSFISEDKIATNVCMENNGFCISDIWQTSKMPVNLEKEFPIENKLFPSVINNGTYFRYVVIPPDRDLDNLNHNNNDAVHPLMHKTQSLDYIVILSGEVYLMTESDETLLKAGDIVIQRSTQHAWSNRSDEPCIQIAILIDAIEN